MSVYFEFYPVGQQIKVSAIDEKTGLEVSVFGPRNVAQRDIEALALRKLERQLQKQSQDLARESKRHQGKLA